MNGVFRNFNGEAYRAATWAADVGPAGFMSTNADHFLMAQKAQNEGYGVKPFYILDPLPCIHRYKSAYTLRKHLYAPCIRPTKQPITQPIKQVHVLGPVRGPWGTSGHEGLPGAKRC